MARVLISMPDELLERIDRQVGRAGGSRSGFLQEAARRQLGWPDPAIFDAALARGREALAAVGQFDSAELIRAGRDARDARDKHRR
jgi:Arc/MetJ-type ribon-helix-helix transcriptional regulator